MSPADARRFIVALTTSAPGKRVLTRWEQMQIDHNQLTDVDAVHMATKLRDAIVAEWPSVIAAAKRDGAR